MIRPSRLAIAALGVAAFGMNVVPFATRAAAAAEKAPPSCAALAFRPVPSGLTDGDQDAGTYKSRFGQIVVKATVETGEPQNYFIEVDGKKPAPVADALPASVASCAAAKKLSAPGPVAARCTGERFKVLIDHSSKQRYILLYARKNEAWQLCSAGKV